MTDRMIISWPERIHISQENYGAHNTNVYDADTGKQLTWILEIAWVMSPRDGTWVRLLQSKYDPPKMDTLTGEDQDPDIFEPTRQGIVCTERMYPCYHLDVTCGVKKYE